MVDYSNPYVYVTTFAEILVFITIFSLNIKVYRRYKERDSQVALELFRTFFCFGLTPALQMLDTLFLDTLTEPYFDYLPSFGYSAAFLTATIGNWFLIRFTFILYKESKFEIPNLIGGISIFTGILFFITRTGGMVLASIIIMLLVIIISFIIFTYLMRVSLSTAKNIGEIVAKRGFQLIGIFGICLNFMYIFFIIEAIVGFGEFTVFASIGWFFGLVGSVCAYIGFIMPDWFKKRYEQ